MLTLDDLAGMREVQESALPDTAVISRLTRTYDDTGGYSETSTTVATVACRVTRERPREVVQGEQPVVLADWVVTLPYGTDVRPDDNITVNGQVLHVVGLLNASWRTAERALCTG